MRKTKRLLSLLISVIMVFSMFAVLPLNVSAANGIDSKINSLLNLFPSGSYFTQNGSACSHGSSSSCDNCYLPNILTRSDLVGLGYKKGTDYTGSWTCVAFANFAFRYIYGKMFSTNNYSQVASGSFSQSTLSVAKKGDIIGFYNSSGAFQHYAVYMGTSTSSNATFYQANFGGVPKVNYGTWTYANMNSYYGGGSMKVFRANNYNSVSGGVNSSWIKASKSQLFVGEDITFTFGANNATSYDITIKHLNEVVKSVQNVKSGVTYTFAEEGTYTAYITAKNSTSSSTSSTVTFYQIEPLDLGDNFVAKIKNPVSGYYVSADEMISSDSYPNVYLASEETNPNNVWEFIKYEDNSYEITNLATGNCLDVQVAGTANGTNIGCYPENDSDAQRWYIRKNVNGYALASKLIYSGDVSIYGNNSIYGDCIFDGANIVLYGNDSVQSQRFVFEYIDAASAGFKYEITDGEVKITDYIGYSTDLTIPSEIEGYPVTSIGNSAFRACNSIKHVTIPDSVKNIGTTAFGECSSLESVTIPESVKNIGEYAFYYTNLKSITIPSSVTNISPHTFSYCENLSEVSICEGIKSIGEHAFYYCSNIKTIILPESLEIIDDNAFEHSGLNNVNIPGNVYYIGYSAFYDTKLSSVTIPASVINIGNSAFSKCPNLEIIIVDENNPEYDSRNNCNAIIRTSSNTLINGCKNTVIPSNVRSLAMFAFEGCKCTNINIPPSVSTIGDNAFYCCDYLTNINLPSSITRIPIGLFGGCTSLTNITFTSSVTSIDFLAFEGCSNLTDVYFVGTQAQWDSITIDEYNEILTSVNIHYVEPEVETYIVKFMDWDGTVLDTQTIECGMSATAPADPTRDGYEFTGWDTNFSNVQSDLVVTATYTPLTLVNGDYEYTVSEGEVTITAYTGSATNLVIPEYIDDYPVAKIGKDAFSYCQSLVSVELPSTLKEIGETAFKYCKTLAGIRIPEGVATIGKSAFYGCTALTGIAIPSTVTRIGDEAFVFCEGLTSVEISEGVETIGSYAFRGCLELATVVIPKSVTSVEERAFYGCSELDDVYFNGTSAQWSKISVADYNEPLTTATIHYNSKDIPLGLEYTIANGTVTIKGYTGSNAILDIPETIEGYPVIAIGTNAFDSLTNLLSIKLPESVTSIGEGAFKYCKGIRSITLPEGIKEISANAFYGCTSLVEITIPDGVEKIGNQAFIYCEALKSVTIPSTVTDIGDFAFRGCSVLQNVEISEGLKNIGASAFRGCSVLREVSLPKSVESIGEKAFYACSKLADIYYGGSERRWNDVSVAEGNDTLASATMHYAISAEDEIFTVTFVDYDGTVLDTQKVDYGNSATAPADPKRDGYTFKGWDSDFSCITEDTTVTARYTRIAPKGTLRIEVTGGTGFTISVNGSSARPQGSVYRNSKIEIGATVTVTARETANATFVGWMNPATGIVLSSDYEYTFTASGNDSINAVFSTVIEGVQVVTFKNDKQNRVLDSQYYSAEDAIEFPDAPTQVGFDFAGWSMTEAEIKSAIATGQDVEVAALWTRQVVPVQVTVNGGTGTGSYNANAAVTVVANAAPAGQKFAYWTDTQGNIKSYNAEYKFYPSADVEVTAVFVAEDAVIDYQILVDVDSIDTVTVEGKNVFYFSWYCPEEYSFVKAGILAVNKDNYNESTFAAGTSDGNVYDRNPSGTNKAINSVSWTKSSVTSGQTWVAKAYVQYRDADGALVTVYSDVVEATKD